MGAGQWLRLFVPDPDSLATMHVGKPSPEGGYSGVTLHSTANFVARTEAHTYVQSARTVTMHGAAAANLISMGDTNIYAGSHVNVGGVGGVVIAAVSTHKLFKDEIPNGAVDAKGNSTDPTDGGNKSDPKMPEAPDKYVNDRNTLYNDIQKATNIANTIAGAVATAKAVLGFSWEEGWLNLQKFTSIAGMVSVMVGNATNVVKLARGVGELKTKEEKDAEEAAKKKDLAAAEAEAKAIKDRKDMIKALAQYGKDAKNYGGVLAIPGGRTGAKLAGGALGGDLNQQQRDAGILDFKNDQKGVKVLPAADEAAIRAKAVATPDDLRAAGYDPVRAQAIAGDRDVQNATAAHIAANGPPKNPSPTDVFSAGEIDDIRSKATVRPEVHYDQAMANLYEPGKPYPTNEQIDAEMKRLAGDQAVADATADRAAERQRAGTLTSYEERQARAGATPTAEDTARYSHLADPKEAQAKALKDAQDRAVEGAKKAKQQDLMTLTKEETALGTSRADLAKKEADFDTWNRTNAGKTDLTPEEIKQGAALKTARDSAKKDVDASEAKVRAIKAKGTTDTIAKVSSSVDAGMAAVGLYNAVAGLAGAVAATKADKPAGIALVSDKDVFVGTKASGTNIAYGGFNFVVPAAFAGFNVLSGGNVSFQSTFKTEMFSVQSVSLEGGLGAELVAAGPVQLMSRMRDTSVMGREIKIGAQKADIQRSYAAINTKLMKPWNPMKQQPTREVIVKAEGNGKIELLIDAKKRIAIENQEITVTYMSNKVKFTENEITVTANDKLVVKGKTITIEGTEKIELKAPDVAINGKTAITEGGSSVKVGSSSVDVKATSVSVNDESLT